VWKLGMDESPAAPVYQYQPRFDYHFGGLGTLTVGTVLSGQVSGDTFGHVQLEDHGLGGAYRFSVASDGFVWAIGRVR